MDGRLLYGYECESDDTKRDSQYDGGHYFDVEHRFTPYGATEHMCANPVPDLQMTLVVAHEFIVAERRYVVHSLDTRPAWLWVNT